MGGQLPRKGSTAGAGHFYPPTIITGATPAMRIWQEEVFGPVMTGAEGCVCGMGMGWRTGKEWMATGWHVSSLPCHPPATAAAVVKFGSNDEAAALANDCPFGLGSSVFSASRARTRRIAEKLEVRGEAGCGRGLL